MKILPEAVDWSSVSVRYNTGGVDVIEGALVTDGRGEVRPLLLVDHEGHHKEESDDYDDEQAQGHRSSGRLCGGKNGVRSCTGRGFCGVTDQLRTSYFCGCLMVCTNLYWIG